MAGGSISPVCPVRPTSAAATTLPASMPPTTLDRPTTRSSAVSSHVRIGSGTTAPANSSLGHRWHLRTITQLTSRCPAQPAVFLLTGRDTFIRLLRSSSPPAADELYRQPCPRHRLRRRLRAHAPHHNFCPETTTNKNRMRVDCPVQPHFASDSQAADYHAACWPICHSRHHKARFSRCPFLFSVPGVRSGAFLAPRTTAALENTAIPENSLAAPRSGSWHTGFGLVAYSP